MAGAEGLEPSARGFGDHCSTNWAIPLFPRCLWLSFWLPQREYYNTRLPSGCQYFFSVFPTHAKKLANPHSHAVFCGLNHKAVKFFWKNQIIFFNSLAKLSFSVMHFPMILFFPLYFFRNHKNYSAVFNSVSPSFQDAKVRRSANPFWLREEHIIYKKIFQKFKAWKFILNKQKS